MKTKTNTKPRKPTAAAIRGKTVSLEQMELDADKLAAVFESGDFTTEPLDAADKELHRRARRRKPGRPTVGKGAEKVLISCEKGLLKQIDRQAKTYSGGRSGIMADGAKLLLRLLANPC